LMWSNFGEQFSIRKRADLLSAEGTIKGRRSCKWRKNFKGTGAIHRPPKKPSRGEQKLTRRRANIYRKGKKTRISRGGGRSTEE